ncbi:FAST kinase domain-containing protein 2, mitochondrial isoform X2 [Notolabrus celidotus]|nr:FAST kinase domain-containing protein 2, mitochondrial isoform X2 [Notolabrus celidotus]
MRLGIRCCSLRSLLQQRSILITTPIKDSFFPSTQLAHKLGSRQKQGSVVRPVRFYSQERIHSEELLSSSPPAEVPPDDPTSDQLQRTSPFMDHLQQCISPSDVLDLTCQFTPTPRQVSKCLTYMWSSTKKMTDEQRRYELRLMFESPAFDLLLQKAMKNVGNLRNEDLAYSLLSMVKLGVPQRSRVVQTFLRACQERLNDFNEKGLSILSSCLEHMESCPNVSALKDGMRLVAKVKLNDIQNVVALQTMMRLLGKDAPLDFKRKLEMKALSMQDQFSLPNSQHMISTMATMGFRSKPLLEVCTKKIRENLHTIPFSRLFKVLQSCSELHYRDPELLMDISEYVASVIDIWSNKQAVLFLYSFEKLGFSPDALMKAFAEKVIADPDVLMLKDLLCVLKVYSSLNYDLQQQRQQFLESLSQVVESYLPKMSRFELLRVVHYLCLLGHFPPAPLELLLQDGTLEHLKTTPPKFIPKQEKLLRVVDLCLRLDRPPVPQPLTVPSSILGDLTPIRSSVSPLLSDCLREVLEDQVDTELQEAVLEEDFYFIDAVITKPPSCQTSVTEASSAGDEASPVESSHRVAVFCAIPSNFCFGTSRPCGPLAAKIRHLRILGYKPVVVVEHKLHSLSKEERTEFLRGLIFPEHHRSDVN